MGGSATSTWPLPVRYPQLGARIRAARVDAGLTLDKLAGRIGSTRQHLIKLEKGQHKPLLEMRLKLAEATGQPVEWFEATGDEA